jgi:hypothetical protein
VREFVGAAGMTAVASQLFGVTGIVAVLTAIFAVGGSDAIAGGVSASFGFSHGFSEISPSLDRTARRWNCFL